ncbi:DExH-box ATP-dependent RNA helicase DExH12-like protein, partial [Tanacetum coccineum]
FLNLENIVSHQDGLFMANKKYELPVRSYMKQKQGYKEVYLPALQPKPLVANEKLALIKNMPSWAQHAFEGMTELNKVQSRVYETALFKADNILLSAPTGAGKTIVAMLTILQQIGLHINEDGLFNNSDYKIVYVSPVKDLVTKVVRILSNCLKYHGVTVIKLTGDQYSTQKQIKEA